MDRQLDGCILCYLWQASGGCAMRVARPDSLEQSVSLFPSYFLECRVVVGMVALGLDDESDWACLEGVLDPSQTVSVRISHWFQDQQLFSYSEAFPKLNFMFVFHLFLLNPSQSTYMLWTSLTLLCVSWWTPQVRKPQLTYRCIWCS